MYGTPMLDTFIRLDTLEYNTIRVPTQFLNRFIREVAVRTSVTLYGTK
jgi:hypothetical protein